MLRERTGSPTAEARNTTTLAVARRLLAAAELERLSNIAMLANAGAAGHGYGQDELNLLFPESRNDPTSIRNAS